MGARTPVEPNDRYGAREQRRPVEGQPPPNEVLPRNGSPPRIINDRQPATTPKTLKSRSYDIDEDIPIYLSQNGNVFSPPPFGQQIRWELAALKRRIHEEIKILARGELEGEEWIAVHARHLKLQQPWPPHIDGPAYLASCRDSLARRFPRMRVHRTNLDDKKVVDYLLNQIAIINTLHLHLRYFQNVYSHFASIANDNFRGGLRGGKEVTLGRLIQAFATLPSVLTEDELLDVAFYGLIDSSLIHMDHHVMSDLLGLAAALGQLRYGRFRPTEAQARAYLYTVGVAQDPSPYRKRLEPHREKLAKRLMERFVPADLQDDLTHICCAIACQRPIPENLWRLQSQIAM